jgi:hypothetical protein
MGHNTEMMIDLLERVEDEGGYGERLQVNSTL